MVSANAHHFYWHVKYPTSSIQVWIWIQDLKNTSQMFFFSSKSYFCCSALPFVTLECTFKLQYAQWSLAQSSSNLCAHTQLKYSALMAYPEWNIQWHNYIYSTSAIESISFIATPTDTVVTSNVVGAVTVHITLMCPPYTLINICI